MIITRTPYRISFLGGGTDYPGWYRENGGAVLATSINKYCYLTCRYLPPFFEHRYRIVYSKTEDCMEVSQIRHPVVRAIFEHWKMDRGVELHHDGDLPARSGMGSSSSFTVGLIHALHALRGQIISKEEMAREAIFIEQELLKEHVGSQDQISAAYGGLNHIQFHPGGQHSVHPVVMSPEALQNFNDHFMLFFTGIQRFASAVAGAYVPKITSQEKHLRRLHQLVNEGITLLSSGGFDSFGTLLHDAWQEKRAMSDVISTPAIEEIYDEARSAGATGGKLIGAGGGGFMLFFAKPEDQPAIRKRLSKLLQVPFLFETGGSMVLHYSREEDYSALDVARQQLAP